MQKLRPLEKVFSVVRPTSLYFWLACHAALDAASSPCFSGFLLPCLPAGRRRNDNQSLPALLLLGFWERNSKSTPLVKVTRNLDVSTVGSGNGSRQTESQADARLRSTLIAPVESLKYSRKITWRYANASIFDRDDEASFIIL